MSACSFLAVVLTGLIQTQSTSQSFEARLRELFRDSSHPIAVVLPSEMPVTLVPSFRKSPFEYRARDLSWSFQMDVHKIGGATVLWREPIESVYGATESGRLTDWLTELPSSVLSNLIKGTDFHSMDDESKRHLARLGGDLEGLRARMANGDPIHVQLELVPLIKVQYPNYADYESAMPLKSGYDDEKHKTSANPSRPQLELSPPPTRSSSALDFGEGAVLTLFEIRQKLRDQMKSNVVADDRLATETMFIRGKFERVELEEMLVKRFTARTPAVTTWTRKNRWDALKGALTGALANLGEIGGVPATEFSEGKTRSLEDLKERFPHLAELLTKQAASNSNGYKLAMGVAVRLRAPGISPSNYGVSTIGGKPAPTGEANFRSFIITP